MLSEDVGMVLRTVAGSAIANDGVRRLSHFLVVLPLRQVLAHNILIFQRGPGTHKATPIGGRRGWSFWRGT